MAASRSGKPRRTVVVSSSAIGSELQISEKKGVSNSQDGCATLRRRKWPGAYCTSSKMTEGGWR
jgi:hypothetical protein